MALVRSGRHKRSKWLLMFSWWLTTATWLTVFSFTMQACVSGDRSIIVAIVILVMSYPATAGSDWLLENQYAMEKYARG